MARSGYSEDYDGDLDPALYRNACERAIKGGRGQKFLRELAAEMDAMPEKKLITGELIDGNGACCTMGVIFKAKGLDVKNVDYDCQETVAKLINIAPSMAREIAYNNDDDFGYEAKGKETPEQRWQRMRKWVDERLTRQVAE